MAEHLNISDQENVTHNADKHASMNVTEIKLRDWALFYKNENLITWFENFVTASSRLDPRSLKQIIAFFFFFFSW